MQKLQNPDVINETINTSADISIEISVSDLGELFATVTTNTGNFGILPDVTKDVSEINEKFDTVKPKKIIKPEIISLNKIRNQL